MMSTLPANVSLLTVPIAERACPACGAVMRKSFYHVTDIPVQSNLLVESAQIAADFPRGELHLAACENCAFITNVTFDESQLMMSQKYEASQAASPTFGKFARHLAQQWIDRYELQGKRIIEIGCGQGEFLDLICEMSDAVGVGFDPVVRRKQGKSDKVAFIPGKFEDYASAVGLNADFICCRHTLEHIAEPLEFLTRLREVCGDAIIAFEVPDTVRVMNEGAFWDIYYEHCSYFTPESLHRVFQRAGFETLRTSLEFDNQYLVIEARATGGQRRDMPTLAELRRTQEFARTCGKVMSDWIERCSNPQHTKRIVWGSGSKAVGFLTTLGLADQFAAVVDINPAKQGSYLPGTPLKIVSPKTLLDIQPDFVVIMNPIYKNEIASSLAEMKLFPEIVAL